MKFTTAIFLLPALALANPLTVIIEGSGLVDVSGTCNEDERYCGSYLLKKGYTEADLAEKCKLDTPVDHCDAFGLNNTLFACEYQNRIEKVKWCRRTCRETGPGNEDDFCEPAFLSSGLSVQQNAGTVRIEV